MDCKEVPGVREQQRNHSLSQSGAHPTESKNVLGVREEWSTHRVSVCQPATEGLQDVEILWGESLRV